MTTKTLPEFRYVEPFVFEGVDETPFRKLTSDLVSVDSFAGREIVRVAPEA